MFLNMIHSSRVFCTPAGPPGPSKKVQQKNGGYDSSSSEENFDFDVDQFVDEFGGGAVGRRCNVHYYYSLFG